MSLSSQRLFDISTRLQIYVEGVKANQTSEFDSVIATVEQEFKKLLNRVKYKTLDGLSKAELNKLVVSLRRSQSAVYSSHTLKVLRQLQDFMQASLTVNRISYAYAKFELEDIPSDKKASELIEEQQDSSLIPLFGIGAILAGATTLWPKIANEPIAANGALLTNFLKAFNASSQISLENLIRKGYSNASTTSEVYEEAAAQLGKIKNQYDAVLSTIIQHVSANTSAAVTSALWDEYIWLSVLDSSTTKICRSRNGKIYKTGKGPVPPAHIRCRSHTMPYDGDYEELSFFAWIKKQGKALQNFALGRTVANMLREGTLNAADLDKLANVSKISIEDFGKSAPIIAKGE